MRSKPRFSGSSLALTLAWFLNASAPLGCGGNDAPAAGGGTGGAVGGAGGASGGGPGSGGAAAGGAPGTGGAPGGSLGDGAEPEAAPGTGGGGATDAGAEGGATPEVAPPTPFAGNPFVYVGCASDPRLHIFQLDMTSGALTAKGAVMSNPSPNYIAIHPTRKFLYVTSQVTAGRVVAFAVDGATGTLTKLNDVASGGAEPAHISFHRSLKWLFVANYFGANASVLPLGEDGRLGAAVSTVPAGAEAHFIVEDGASGNFVFVPSKGSNRVGQFKFDPASGKLTPNDPPWVAEGGAPRHMAFHRSGRFAYLLTEGTRLVVAYKYDATTGLLSPLARVTAGNSGFASTIAMHPSKDLFYAAVRGPDTIGTFSIDAEGRPKLVAQVSDELSYPWDFSVDPTGRYLVAANNTSSSIKVFRIAEDTGTLTLVGGATVPAQVRTVRVLFAP